MKMKRINRLMQAKRVGWLLGLVALIFCLCPATAGAVSQPTELSGASWDQYVETHAELFNGKAAKGDNSSFSSQELQINKGILGTNKGNKGRSQTSLSRYTVLVIDISGSMAGLPIETAKSAANKFGQQMLAAKGENYVALVGFSSSGTVYSQFTDNAAALETAIGRLGAGGGTETNQGLLTAASLFEKEAKEGSVKNIVVLSDGEPQDGDAAIKTADKLTAEKHYIYSLGFFHNLSGTGLERARTFMDRIQNAGYYDVTSTDELEFEFDKIADDITSRSNIFKYPSSDKASKASDGSAVYYYKNDYFKKDAYQYNEQLATMSLSLALSAFGSSDVGTDYQNKSNNAKNLLAETGFSQIKTNTWFTKKPETDSIGVIAGQKQLKAGGKSYTLIALAIRGGGYESEWASNFTLGKSGYHQGFSQARDQVLQFLTEDYIKANGISGNIKIWITGFSRAAATANLVAGKLDEGVTFDKCQFTLKDLYAYTFETPAGAVDKAGVNISKGNYKNIFNIINSNDPVPRVAPKDWGFKRYGEDKVLPSKERSSEKVYEPKSKNMQTRFTALAPTTPYLIDSFAMTKIDWSAIAPGGQPFVSNATQSIFLDDFVKIIANEAFKNRTSYQQHYEELLRKSFASKNGTANNSIWQFTSKKLTELLMTEGYGALKQLVIPSNAENWVKKILSGANISYEVKDLRPLTSIVSTLFNHPIVLHALKEQTESLGQAHFPELCLAWLQSQDTNYVKGGKASFVSGNYRIIRINCPVDVQVYNDDNELVAAIVKDEPQAVTSLVSRINENGEKLIYLPPDGSYTVKTTATADGKMTYSINEYSYEAGGVRKVQSYNDLPLEKEKTYTAQVPAYSESNLTDGVENGSETTYILKDDATNKVITPSIDLAGEKVVEANFKVSAVSENELQGTVVGGGTYQTASFSQLSALPNEAYTFMGWYEGDKLVSRETTYRFRVDRSVNLTGKFSSKTAQASLRYNQSHGAFDPEKRVVLAGDWQTFIDAYRDEQVTKIVLTNDIEDSSASGAKGPTNYQRKKSIEIDGQNHVLTLKPYHSLQTSDQADSYTEQVAGKSITRSLFHMHDISLRQNLTGDRAVSGGYGSLTFVGALDSGKAKPGYGSRKENRTKNWYFRFGNINNKNDDRSTNKRGLARLVTAYASEVTLYGKVDLSTSAENMYVGSLIIEDGTNWTGKGRYDTHGLVWFVLAGHKETTGAKKSLNIGENCQISLQNDKKGKYDPAFYGHYQDVVIGKKSTVAIDMKGSAWRFDYSGSLLTIQYGATLKLVTRDKDKALQFGSQDFSANKVLDCHVKVEPGGSLFVTGATSGPVGDSVVDFSGRFSSKNCSIELDNPKAYSFDNQSSSVYASEQSVLNLRDDSNRFIIKEAALNSWQTKKQSGDSTTQLPDQTLTHVQHFELYGMKGNRHSQDILDATKGNVLLAYQLRRISNQMS